MSATSSGGKPETFYNFHLKPLNYSGETGHVNGNANGRAIDQLLAQPTQSLAKSTQTTPRAQSGVFGKPGTGQLA